MSCSLPSIILLLKRMGHMGLTWNDWFGQMRKKKRSRKSLWQQPTLKHYLGLQSLRQLTQRQPLLYSMCIGRILSWWLSCWFSFSLSLKFHLTFSFTWFINFYEKIEAPTLCSFPPNLTISHKEPSHNPVTFTSWTRTWHIPAGGFFAGGMRCVIKSINETQIAMLV